MACHPGGTTGEEPEKIMECKRIEHLAQTVICAIQKAILIKQAEEVNEVVLMKKEAEYSRGETRTALRSVTATE